MAQQCSFKLCDMLLVNTCIQSCIEFTVMRFDFASRCSVFLLCAFAQLTRSTLDLHKVPRELRQGISLGAKPSSKNKQDAVHLTIMKAPAR